MRPGLPLAVVASVVLSCGGREHDSSSETRRAQDTALGGEVAALVGSQPIALSAVTSVAHARRITAREAAMRIVDDEIVASAARSRGLDRSGRAAWGLVSARGRFASDRLFEEAKSQGLPDDEEVRLLSDRHWVQVDRPPAVIVIHAIVIHPKDPSLKGRARALADEIQGILAKVSNDDFEAKARERAHAEPKFELRVERLPPFTDEGWVTEGGGRMDPVFAKEGFALASIGDTSRVVETAFGFHVIRLLGRNPEKRMPIEHRRLAFADEVYSLRARDLLAARLSVLRGSHPITISPAAEPLMRSVTVAAPEGTERP